jgi:hypothetical protein
MPLSARNEDARHRRLWAMSKSGRAGMNTTRPGVNQSVLPHRGMEGVEWLRLAQHMPSVTLNACTTAGSARPLRARKSRIG